jgi:hypothetical protein
MIFRVNDDDHAYIAIHALVLMWNGFTLHIQATNFPYIQAAFMRQNMCTADGRNNPPLYYLDCFALSYILAAYTTDSFLKQETLRADVACPCVKVGLPHSEARTNAATPSVADWSIRAARGTLGIMGGGPCAACALPCGACSLVCCATAWDALV